MNSSKFHEEFPLGLGKIKNLSKLCENKKSTQVRTHLRTLVRKRAYAHCAHVRTHSTHTVFTHKTYMHMFVRTHAYACAGTLYFPVEPINIVLLFFTAPGRHLPSTIF